MKLLKPERLIGRRLMDVLASKEPLVGEGWEGLPTPLIYNVVLQLDNGEQLWLLGGELRVWSRTEGVTPATPDTFNIDPSVVFKDQLITGVSADEVGNLVVELENRTTLQVTPDWGTCVCLSRPGLEDD